MSYARKVDTNQVEIVETLRQVGYRVLHLHAVGKGCPDILVGGVGIKGVTFNVLMELKSSHTAKLTKDEQEFRATWPGPLYVVYSAEEAVRVMELHRRTS